MKPGSARRWFFILLIVLAVFICDRVSKYAAYHALTSGQSIAVIPGVFHITLVLNKGTAFGLFSGKGALFAAFTLFAVFVITAFMWKNASRNAFVIYALSLILGGAAGNLVDRISIGSVIDFLDFRIWPVFNIADSAITIGTIVLVINILLTENVKRKTQDRI